jgi:hypothetical protein
LLFSGGQSIGKRKGGSNAGADSNLLLNSRGIFDMLALLA